MMGLMHIIYFCKIESGGGGILMVLNERINTMYINLHARYDTYDIDIAKRNRMQYREYLFVLSTSSAFLLIVKSNGIPSGHGTPHHRPRELGE